MSPDLILVPVFNSQDQGGDAETLRVLAYVTKAIEYLTTAL